MECRVGEKVFELVLVDIKETAVKWTIKCIKKNMYDPDLKYIATSYRWGELKEQLVPTPDYTAHITSFNLNDLIYLCFYIQYEPDLCNINYLWIDAISVDQNNDTKKKDIILNMNQIYKNASSVLAIPDLHREYLLKHPANKEIIINLLEKKYSNIIFKEIANDKNSHTNNSINDNTKGSITTHSIQHQHQQQHHTDKDQYLLIQKLTLENERLKMEIKENKDQEIRKIYQFLAYLIDDWSNRTWVISEYFIAREKYMKYETPLKYTFISLLQFKEPFFSYHFNDADADNDNDNDNQKQQQQRTINNEEEEDNDKNKKILTCEDVNDLKTFKQFLKSRFMQQSYLEMMLNSNATSNQDRFNAILPLWNKYQHHIKNISEWNITDMTSVRIKLYEIMDDLWDKAILLYACSSYSDDYILPTFAKHSSIYNLEIIERADHRSVAYKEFETMLLSYIKSYMDEEIVEQIEQLINDYKTNSKTIWTENLTIIQFDLHYCCLSVKLNSYFIRQEKETDTYYGRNLIQKKLSLDKDDEIHYVFLPFFTFSNRHKNKWVLTSNYVYNFEPEHLCFDDYTFNIY
ncbi:unnamed protein product [Cunninghamella blakesleeana]